MDDDTLELLAEVAAMYYEQGLTQEEIGKKLNLSRVKIYRLLKQAADEGVVEITVHYPLRRAADLEDQFVEKFGLKEALIFKSKPGDARHNLRGTAQLAARHLEKVLADGVSMAVCLGSTTYEVIDSIRPSFRARVHIAQAMGSMPFEMRELDSSALARHLAQKLGGEVLYLASPLYADSAEDAEVLRNQQEIRRTLLAARTAQVALVGVGNLDPQTSGFVRAGFISQEELRWLMQDGAVGDMAGRIFSQDGSLHPCTYNQRVIGITFDELRHIPHTIAVARGPNKVPAILGALRTATLKVLCTDDETAREVLRLC